MTSVKIIGNFIQNKTDHFVDCILIDNDVEITISNIPPKSARNFPNFCKNPVIKSFILQDRKINTNIEDQTVETTIQYTTKPQNYILQGNFFLTSDVLNINNNAVIYVSTDKAYGYVSNSSDSTEKQKYYLFSMSISSLTKTCSLNLYSYGPYEVIHFDGTYEYNTNEYIYTFISTKTINTYNLVISYSSNAGDDFKPLERKDISGLYHGSSNDLFFDMDMKVYQMNIFTAEITYLESVRNSSTFGFLTENQDYLMLVNESVDPPEIFYAQNSNELNTPTLQDMKYPKNLMKLGFMTDGNREEVFLLQRDFGS